MAAKTNTLDRKAPHKFSVLIVDDMPANLRLLFEILSKKGYQVRVIPNGKLALASVQDTLPDLILLDVYMPGLDGYAVAEQLKSNSHTAGVPIIFVSANDDVSAIVKGFEHGGVDYILKPFREAEVLARVQTHLTVADLKKEVARKTLEEERSRLLTTFIEKVAHEFRTPLTVIRNYSDLLERNIDKPERWPKYIDRIKLSEEQLDNLVSGMLFFVKLGLPENFNPQPFNFMSLCQNLRDWYDDSRLQFVFEQEKIMLTADAELLNKALREIVNNALANLAPNGRVTLCANAQESLLHLTIADNGRGIPANQLPYVCDLFYRTDQAHTTRGLGLGLAITQRIIQRHRGRLTITSELNQGTTVTIELPLNPP